MALMTAHRWSGWPGAWCLDCGDEDANAACIAEHYVCITCVFGHVQCEEDHPMMECDEHQNRPCPCPGEGHFDPYMRNEARRNFLRLLDARATDLELEIPELTPDRFKRAMPWWQFKAIRDFGKWVARFGASP